MIEKLFYNIFLFIFHNFILGCAIRTVSLSGNWIDGTQRNHFASTREAMNKIEKYSETDTFGGMSEEQNHSQIPELSAAKERMFSSVRGFQRNFLKKEKKACKDKHAKLDDAVNKSRKDLCRNITERLLLSIWYHTSSTMKETMLQLKTKHKRKIENLSATQDSTLLKTKGYLTVLDDIKVPKV